MARVLQGLALLGLVAFGSRAEESKKLRFSHSIHAKLGDLGPILRLAREKATHLHPDGTVPGGQCQACHSGVVSGVARTGLSKMGDCLVCHTKVDPPFSCGFCHTQPAAELKPVSHTRDFLDKHTAGLAKIGLSKTECAVCHGRKFTCLGCH